jgi:spermidine synthase
MDGLWYTENWIPGINISLKIKTKLYEEKTPFQFLEVVDTDVWGKALFLDHCIMTTDRDEYIYHEMITHIVMNAHKEPKNVLVIGGGDGGVIREVMKHSSVEKAVLCEIDEAVVRAAKEYFPQIASELENPKVEVLFADGVKHIKEHQDFYDVIVVDSTDPVGPAEGLFQREFYQCVHDALKEDGIFVAQTESPFVYPDIVPGVYHTIESIFPITREYLAAIPTYPGSMWGFTLGSKKYDPLQLKKKDICAPHTKYYSTDMHFAAFVLPPFVKELIGGE